MSLFSHALFLFSTHSTALTYSITVLLFLRMRSRGELGNVDDQHFGRVPICCGGGCYLPLGFVFRRYVRHLQTEEGNSNNTRTRNMTRQERRAAVEEILLEESNKTKRSCNQGRFSLLRRKTNETATHSSSKGEEQEPTTIVENPSDEQQSEPIDLEQQANNFADDLSSCTGPVCSICLADFESDETTMQVQTCVHQFHKCCILDWLERSGKTDCPCCRVEMVSEEDVWRTVKRNRRERKKLRRRKSSIEDGVEESNSETEEYLGEDGDVVVVVEETNLTPATSAEQSVASDAAQAQP